MKSNCEIVRLVRENMNCLPRKQEPFALIGELIPRFDGREWSVSELLYDLPGSKTYPDDNFDPSEYVDNPEQAAYVAICDEKCVGSIRVCRRWNNNAFIDDLEVSSAYRGRGVGTALMNAAFEWGREAGLSGVSLETQNVNLLACRFYLKYGFRLGGIDIHAYDAYKGVNYKGEKALYFYKEN